MLVWNIFYSPFIYKVLFCFASLNLMLYLRTLGFISKFYSVWLIHCCFYIALFIIGLLYCHNLFVCPLTYGTYSQLELKSIKSCDTISLKYLVIGQLQLYYYYFPTFYNFYKYFSFIFL